MSKKYLLSIFLFVSIQLPALPASIEVNAKPVIGAQVIIEKGQSAEEIESLFALLKSHNMDICRIRMFESYMHDGNGNWDFSTFDHAFRAAERNQIKIIATLFPMVEFTNIGGFKFPDSDAHLASVEEYIRQVVTHFRGFPSLYGWVLMNEIGTGKAPFGKPLTARKFAEWQKTDSVKPFLPNGNPVMQFQEERFLLDYNTWYLSWLKAEVRKYDSKSHLHVNTHAVFETYAEYNFPQWRTILDSFGGSAHASWHFGNFTRNKYHFAMAANSEIIRSGAGTKPWIMTELQGGNNVWSGGIPMCPTKQEIEQWMWTIIGTGGKGMIFWSLNARTAGIEAGEWGMLDLLNQPTERLLAASDIALAIQSNASLFASAKVLESGVNILYTRESLWCERRAETAGAEQSGRKPGAAIRSVAGFYETLAQMGIQANIKCVDEYDFSETNNKGKIIILPHQIALSTRYAPMLRDFATTGGIVIMEGLTAFYNEHMQLQANVHSPFAPLLGANWQDVTMLPEPGTLKIENVKAVLPFHWWRGSIQPMASRAISTQANGQVLATSHSVGQGKVIWLPSLVAIEAHEKDNYLPLSQFLTVYLCPYLHKDVVRFDKFLKGVSMHVLQSEGQNILVLINKSGRNQKIRFYNNQMPAQKCIYPINKVLRIKLFDIQSDETKVWLIENTKK